MKTAQIVIILSLFSATINAYGAEWHFIDSTRASQQDQMQFVDVSTVSYSNERRIARFWLAGFAQSKITAYARKYAKELRPEVSKKLETGYIPDAFMFVDKWKNSIHLSKLTENDLSTIKALIIVESTVNHGGVQPLYKIYVEVQCDTRKAHVLDGEYFRQDGSVGSSLNGRSTDWQYIAPDSTGEAWLQMLCARK